MEHPVIKHVKGTGHVYDLFWGEGWTNHARVKAVGHPGRVTDIVVLSRTTQDHNLIKGAARELLNVKKPA